MSVFNQLPMMDYKIAIMIALPYGLDLQNIPPKRRCAGDSPVLLRWTRSSTVKYRADLSAVVLRAHDNLFKIKAGLIHARRVKCRQSLSKGYSEGINYGQLSLRETLAHFFRCTNGARNAPMVPLGTAGA